MTHSQIKQTIGAMLTRKQICLPDVRKSDGTLLKDKVFIDFDSFETINKPGSMVDFILTVGSEQLLVGLSDGWLKLTDAQKERIEQHGKSFVIIRTDLGVDDWAKAMYTCEKESDIRHEILGRVTEYLRVMYWVYHNKHGWLDGAQ